MRIFMRILTKIEGIFESSDLDKAQFLNFSSALVSSYYVVLLLCLPSESLNTEGAKQLLVLSFIHTIILFFNGLLGTLLIRSEREHRWYIYLSTLLYSLANIVVLYYLGIFSLGTGLVLTGGPIAGIIIFKRPTIMPALLFGLASGFILFYLTAIGKIPYAPIIDNPGESHTNLPWLLLLSALAIPHTALLVFTSITTVNYWHKREEHVRHLSNIDSLTQVSNRRYFIEQLETEIYRAKRASTPLNLLMADLDHFKSINDQYGHQTGDEAIKITANILQSTVRATDIVSRYGGEEFCVLLPEASKEAALQTAERCRKNLENVEINVDNCQVHISASFGLCHISAKQISNDEATIDTMLKAADLALYDAKHQGRNCVVYREITGT